MKSYYIISMLIIVLALVLFLARFEKKRPSAREVVLLAVMVSLAVAGRVAFFMLPQFKPMAAIIIITAICLGSETGFLCGALAAVVSNFFFGQGPWTPWQMFAFGMVGLLSGLIFRKIESMGVLQCVIGGLLVLLVYGFIMDTSNVFMYMDEPNVTSLMASLASGLTFNLVHAVATVVFLYVLGTPMIRKLNRIKKKFGMYR